MIAEVGPGEWECKGGVISWDDAKAWLNRGVWDEILDGPALVLYFTLPGIR